MAKGCFEAADAIHLQGPTSETVKPEDQGLTQGPPMLYPDCEPSRHLVNSFCSSQGCEGARGTTV